jgi:hypothetical protein
MAAPLTCGHFLARDGAQTMGASERDWADQVGKRISTIVIAGLLALFMYGFLGPLVFR